MRKVLREDRDLFSNDALTNFLHEALLRGFEISYSGLDFPIRLRRGWDRNFFGRKELIYDLSGFVSLPGLDYRLMFPNEVHDDRYFIFMHIEEIYSKSKYAPIKMPIPKNDREWEYLMEGLDLLSTKEGYEESVQYKEDYFNNKWIVD